MGGLEWEPPWPKEPQPWAWLEPADWVILMAGVEGAEVGPCAEVW